MGKVRSRGYCLGWGRRQQSWERGQSLECEGETRYRGEPAHTHRTPCYKVKYRWHFSPVNPELSTASTTKHFQTSLVTAKPCL